MTEENYRGVISDRDYDYLYPLNNHYRIWVDDKLTMKYMLAPFDQFLPRYYYHLMRDRGVMKLMDCPSECSADLDGILRLLREKKTLAAKCVTGTHGVGFYRIEATEESFAVNGVEKSEQEFREYLNSLDDYILTEFVEMHPVLKKLNPHSVNTIRVMVINETGSNPIIPFVYMRIGTKRSGVVDNVAQGGMVCKVDVDTGMYHDAESLSNHVYHSEETHPDTGEKLQGMLPNWEIVKKTIIEMSKYLPQLTWLGYDIAITESGFCIIEINSHQGLHKAHEYPPEVNHFLFSAIEKKREKYHWK